MNELDNFSIIPTREVITFRASSSICIRTFFTVHTPRLLYVHQFLSFATNLFVS